MDLLTGKRCGINVQEGAYWRSIGGEQAPVDLETGLQLIYALFTTAVTPVPAELDTCMQCAPVLPALTSSSAMHFSWFPSRCNVQATQHLSQDCKGSMVVTMAYSASLRAFLFR